MNQVHALIIEDKQDNAILFRDVLLLANCQVDNARDGLEALDWLKSHESPQLILLDMNIPHLNGLEVYRYIRQQTRFDITQIIAATANIPLAEQLKKELLTGDLIMHKPVNIMEILKIAEGIANQMSIN